MNTPEIRIQFSWLLYGTISPVLHKKYGNAEEKLQSGEYYEEQTDSYRKAWQTADNQILKALTKELDIEYKQSIIDVNLAPWIRAVSSPLIIGFGTSPNQFVSILIHELIHVLLTDNTKVSIRGKSAGEVDLLSVWKSLFGDDHSFDTLVHIPVHALSKFIYLDILEEPSRLQHDMDDVKEYPDYKLSWDYVEAHDYKEIITNLKKSYNNYES